MIKQRLDVFNEKYGTEQDKAKILKKCIAGILMAIVIMFITNQLPMILSIYFLWLSIATILYFISDYFFMKKENSHKNEAIKKIVHLVTGIIFHILFLPGLLLVALVDSFADITNTVYILKRNTSCFILEMTYHICFMFALFQATVLYAEDGVRLIFMYIFFIVGDKLFCSFFRWILIRGECRHYEKYRYRKEMDIISEYAFLGATTLSIVFGNSEFEKMFVPILLWYSIKLIITYSKEKKNAKLEVQYFNEILMMLQEVDEIFLETIEQEINMSNYIDLTKLNLYDKHNTKKSFFVFFSKRKISKAIESIKGISTKRYVLPLEKDKARDEIRLALNDIVKCIQ